MKEFKDFQEFYNYGYSLTKNIKSKTDNFLASERVEFAREYSDIIRKVIVDNVDEERVVYNSDTLWCNKLDHNDPVGSIFYYYTIRCNVVHNGKDFQIWDFDLLKKSLVELYEIFKQVYDKTFKKGKTK